MAARQKGAPWPCSTGGMWGRHLSDEGDHSGPEIGGLPADLAGASCGDNFMCLQPICGTLRWGFSLLESDAPPLRVARVYMFVCVAVFIRLCTVGCSKLEVTGPYPWSVSRIRR